MTNKNNQESTEITHTVHK